MTEHALPGVGPAPGLPLELDDATGPSVSSRLPGPTAWLSALRRSALMAALLSAIVPGLGQLWAGAWRRAIVVAVPFIALLALTAAAMLAATSGSLSIDDLAGLLLRPDVLTAILVLDVVLLVYRGVAIVDAWVVARRRTGARRGGLVTAISVGLLVALVAGNVAVHAGVAYMDRELASAGETILAGEDPDDVLLPPDDPTLVDDPGWLPGESPEPPGSVVAVPGPIEPRRVRKPVDHLENPPGPPPTWSVDDRLDVLLLGVDAGPGRWSLRTDTMILVSVDRRTGASAMFSIPRNIVNVPLPRESRAAFPGCNCYPRMLNSLYVYAMSHSNLFPGGENRGFRAVAGAIETLTGVNLDGMAIVDLNGFVKLIDALGGLRITVPRAIYDARYPNPNGTGNIEIFIKAGRQKMSGFTALAYARSRHGSSDYSRMGRQQEVLLALRKQVKPCKLLADPAKLLQAIKSTVRTTFKPKDVPEMLRLAAAMDLDRVGRHSISPPTYPEYLTRSDAKRVRSLVQHVFDKTRAKASKKQADDPAFAPPSAGAEPEDPCD